MTTDTWVCLDLRDEHTDSLCCSTPSGASAAAHAVKACRHAASCAARKTAAIVASHCSEPARRLVKRAKATVAAGHACLASAWCVAALSHAAAIQAGQARIHSRHNDLCLSPHCCFGMWC